MQRPFVAPCPRTPTLAAVAWARRHDRPFVCSTIVPGAHSASQDARKRACGPPYRLAAALLFARAIGCDLDAALVERGRAQFDQQIRRLAPVDARRLVIGSAQTLGDDAHGHAQGCLAEIVLGVEFRTLAGEILDDVVQSLIGGAVQRGPAELPGD